jgi:hypothetical protein
VGEERHRSKQHLSPLSIVSCGDEWLVNPGQVGSYRIPDCNSPAARVAPDTGARSVPGALAGCPY